MSLDLDSQINLTESLQTSWTGGRPWILTLSKEIYEIYRELRNDIRQNTDDWNKYQYCERLAYHYYHLGSIYYKFSHGYKLNLSSIRKWTGKCLDFLNDIQEYTLSKETEQLKVDALILFKYIENQCEKLKLKFGKHGQPENPLKYIKQCIILGDVLNTEIKLSGALGCTTEEEQHIRQQIESVQLVCLINDFEDALIVSGQSNSWTTLACYLSQTYRLAGHPIISKRYFRNVQRHLLKPDTLDEEEDEDIRKKLYIMIETEIKDYGSNILEVKKIICQKYQKPILTNIDDAYIENKYIEYCFELWFQNVIDRLNQLFQNKDRNTISNILNSFDNIQKLSQVPYPFNQKEYIQLIDHQYLIKKKIEEMHIKKFKNVFLDMVLMYNDSIGQELVFLKHFNNILSIKKNEWIILELDLKRFRDDKISFHDLIEKILNSNRNEQIGDLKNTAKYFKDIPGMFLLNTLKELISAYLIPIQDQIEVKLVDGRLAIIVTAKNIVLSEVLQYLVKHISETSKVEEVRFVGADIFHIDENLENSCWRGKNVVVYVKKIIVYGSITWNISGKNSDHFYSKAPDGQEAGDHGKKGADGFAGESGGNVLLIAEEAENSELLTIISNGGNGSNGQEGGDGQDGRNGVSISTDDFKTKYPSQARMLLPKLTSDLISVITNDAKEISTNTTNISLWTGCDYVFIEVITEDGNVITHSYTCSITTNAQTFLLYKGTEGERGGNGGECGHGGERGYKGDIKSNFEIIVHANPGENGEDGKGGLFGEHGESGRDMAYLDYQFWKNAIYFGTSRKSKLTFKYYSESTSSNVYCSYLQKFVGFEETIMANTKRKTHSKKINTNKDTTLEHQAKATHKKTIDQNSISASYSHHFSSIEDTFQNLHSEREANQEIVLQALIENEMQQENHTAHLKIKRNVNFRGQKHKGHRINTADAIDESVDHINEFMEENIDIKMMKKKFATLKEIGKLLPVYQDTRVNESTNPKNIANYLIVTEVKHDINDEILGPLDQFLYECNEEQRQTISEYCKELFKSKENSIQLMSFVRSFILEAGHSASAKPIIKKYYDEYKEFLEKHKNSFKTLKHKLSNHKTIYKLWIKSFFNESMKSKLDLEMNKYETLKLDYDCLNKQIQERYDWTECYKSVTVFKEFTEHIEEYGQFSSCYRDILAHAFGINIKLYNQKENGQFVLQNSYNPSEKTVHILYNNNQLYPLKINKDYIRLEEERKKRNISFGNILMKVDELNSEAEIDDYLQKQTFYGNTTIFDHKSNKSFDEIDRNEKMDISHITQYFNSHTEKNQVRDQLEKITLEYIGTQSILRNISLRFYVEGRHVSAQELCYLVHLILTSVIDDKQDMNLFSWIVAAHPQKNWIDELLLIQLENYFKKCLVKKPQWRDYLSKISNKSILLIFQEQLDICNLKRPVSIECIENILCLLSKCPNETTNIIDLSLSEWSYALKEKYWIYRLSQLIDNDNDGKIFTLSYYILYLENTFGTTLVELLIDALLQKKQELSLKSLFEIISYFYNEEWNLNNEVIQILARSTITKWIREMKRKYIVVETERDISQLVELINANANTSNGILEKLPTIEASVTSISNPRYPINGLKLYSLITELNADKESETVTKLENISKKPISVFNEDEIKIWVKAFKYFFPFSKSHEVCFDSLHEETLAVVTRGIELKRELTLEFKFKLRDTQKLAILALLFNKRKTLAQVSTGEGKSLIVVATSIIKSLFCQKVDIITSSSVLAKRDVESTPPKGHSDIYTLFNVNASHNCSEDIEERKKAYSENQVVYGDFSNFERDYLLDRFYGQNILGDRDFQNVIIDEVDSMLLDKGNNMLYLSHDLAGLDKLESVYIYIWQWINRPAQLKKELEHVFNIEAIKNSILDELHIRIHKSDLYQLNSELNKRQVNSFWEYLLKTKILNDKEKLLMKDQNTILRLLKTNPELSKYTDALFYLVMDRIERHEKRNLLNVPNFLKPFIEEHLETWISNAIGALFMKEGIDYVIDIDRTGSSSDCSPNIIVLDRDTGTDQTNCQWENALHQFLQIKHGSALSLQSLKAVFISNVSYFKLYNNMYGLTGTLGSKVERELLNKIHDIDFVTIPTARQKRFNEQKPILCTTKKEWIEKIHIETQNTTEKNRSVLIICETIVDVEALHKFFWESRVANVHIYKRDYEEFAMAQGNAKLEQRHIIIATNLAGRGTDIKLTEPLIRAGGLHVILTYLPNNGRTEQQAFGRAARNGEQGSGQLIILNTEEQEDGGFNILDLKKGRDINELYRISDITEYYETHLKIEEHCFRRFTMQFELINSYLEKIETPDVLKEILLHACLDRWAFWLDRNAKCINKLTDDQSKREFNKSLDKFIFELNELCCNVSPATLVTAILGNLESYQNIKQWFHDPTTNYTNPYHLIKLGKYFAQNKNYVEAIEVFDKIITQEPRFSEAAHYYKAFALIKLEPVKNRKKIKEELRKAAKLFDEHSTYAMHVIAIVNTFKESNNKSIIQIHSYEEQKKNYSNIYHTFSRSINSMLSELVTPECFVSIDIDEKLSKVLFQDFLREGVLRKAKVKKNFPDEILKTISLNYGIHEEELNSYFDGLKGRNIINENVFKKELKKNIMIPNRESFWKMLIKADVLTNEIKYIVVDTDKIKIMDTLLFNSINNNISNKVLQLETLEFKNPNYIYLYIEQVEQVRNSSVFKKSEFIKVVGTNKYQLLKKEGMFSYNKLAYINESKIKSTSFSMYDSISLKDLTKENITNDQATYILEELVKVNILIKTEDEKYKLVEIPNKELLLPSWPVYENIVNAILSVCFAYRITLGNIEKQLLNKTEPIKIQLPIKPHSELFWDLIEQKVIRPINTNKSIKNFEHKLKEMYNKNTSNCTELIKESNIKAIANKLKQLTGLLQTLEQPDCALKQLIDIPELDCKIEDLYIFTLNGLDHVLCLEEKKWTWKMLLNTAAVMIIGICQIAFGTLIQIYYAGLMTHVGEAFISEGLNDIIFAGNALRTGYFSWKDYGKHKIESVLYTIATIGVGMYFSKGLKLSHYGNKIGGPTLLINNVKASEMTGKTLIKELNLNVSKIIAKRIAIKGVEGITTVCVHAEIDRFVDNYIKRICDDISDVLLSTLNQTIENYDISVSLERTCRVLGLAKAKETIDYLTNKFFSEQSFINKWSTFACRIVGSITQGMLSAAGKMPKGTKLKTFKTIIKIINETVKWTGRASHILDMVVMINLMLSKIDKELNDICNKTTQTEDQVENNVEYTKFKQYVAGKWKTQLRERAGNIISNNIVSPILKARADKLIRYAGQQMKKAYQASKDKKYAAHFRKLKDQHQETLQNINNNDESSSVDKKHLVNEYHKDLIKLLNKTRNPELFASIILENCPMDLICVQACVHVIPKLLTNIPGITIIVEAGEVRQSFSSTPEGEEGPVITLKLIDNHYEFVNTERTSNNTGFDCLFESLAEQVPQLANINTPSQFRHAIANCILKNPNVQHTIRQGWHAVPLSRNVYGGGKMSLHEEKNTPYQHRTDMGNGKIKQWNFNESKDFDLRDRSKTSNEDLHSQLNSAFDIAVDEISQRLTNMQGASKKPIRLSLDDFKPTKYDIVSDYTPEGEIKHYYYPVELEMKYKVKIPQTADKWEATLIIDIDSPRDTHGLEGPHGPHVGYEIKVKNYPSNVSKTVGHVLLNKEGNENLPDRTNGASYNYFKNLEYLQLRHNIHNIFNKQSEE